MRTKGVTMQDVAKAAGVSQSTVSMILNQKSSSFPTTTIEKVLAAATALNYQFRRTAPPPSNSTVLVIAVQTTNPYYSAMIQGIDRAAITQSISIITACSYHNPALESAYLQMALEHHYLGVIFLYPPDNDAAYANANTRIPIVTICDRSSHVTGDIVELNNFEAGVLAARHLLELGHKNIAVLSSTSVRSTTSRATRVAGVLSEVRKVLSEDHLLILSGNSGSTDMLQEKSSHYQMGHTLAQNKKIFQRNITGLICVNDLVAYGAMDALISRGYRIPEDFSVIGSDNLLFSSMPQVSLTTIEHHPYIGALSGAVSAEPDYPPLDRPRAHRDAARHARPPVLIRGRNRMASLILVSDMDGTLLDDSSRIPPENIAAIRELIAAGGGFTIATGRPVRSIVDHPALRGLITLPVIACNGACLYDTQKQTYLFARRLPDDVQALAARLLAQYPDFGALAFSQADSCTYTLRRTDLTDEVVLRRETVGLHECGPEGAPTPWSKLVLSCPDTAHISRCAELLATERPDVSITLTEGCYIEILPGGTSKGTALEELSRRCDIPLTRFVAIGDSTNDLQMLRCAGRSAAVGNAAEAVKAEVDAVFASNNDAGVADCIRSLLLP